ncbi:MAG: hypothetical protein IMW86_08095 [Hydrogenibacillus sp.]|nr:hypothetical protein [Hydrogenibacillus sp.]
MIFSPGADHRAETARRLAPYVLLLLWVALGAVWALVGWKAEQALEAAKQERRRLEQEVVAVGQALRKLSQSVERVDPARAALALPDAPKDTDLLRLWHALAAQTGATVESVDRAAVDDLSGTIPAVAEALQSNRVRAMRWTLALSGSGRRGILLEGGRGPGPVACGEPAGDDGRRDFAFDGAGRKVGANVDIISFSYAP